MKGFKVLFVNKISFKHRKICKHRHQHIKVITFIIKNSQTMLFDISKVAQQLQKKMIAKYKTITYFL